MSETYEPATVAAVTFQTDDMLNPKTQRGIRWQRGWSVVYDDGAWELIHDRAVSDVRPLVVLDVKDVPGLLATLRDSLGFMYAGQPNALRLQDAIEQIEAQSRLPKPAEPTGLGAVVKDSEGHEWVRYSRHDGCSWMRQTPTPTYVKYDDIDVVGEPLSEGVKAGE